MGSRFVLPARSRTLFPEYVFFTLPIAFHCQVVNATRSEEGIVPAKNLTFPRVAVERLS